MRNGFIRLISGIMTATITIQSFAGGAGVVLAEDNKQTEVQAENAAADTTLPSGPRKDSKGNTVWDCVTFGSYLMDASENAIKQPIKWRVLNVANDGTAFLLADKALDITEYNKQYKEVTWESSSVRSFLNNDFYEAAFSDAEKEAVKSVENVNEDNPIWGTDGGSSTTDKVFCLSLEEATDPAYGFSDPYLSEDVYITAADPARVAADTANTAGKDGYYAAASGNAAYYWLRTPGYNNMTAAGISSNGAVCASLTYVGRRIISVRPAVKVMLTGNEAVWTAAGTESSAAASAAIKGVQKEVFPTSAPDVKKISFASGIKAKQNVATADTVAAPAKLGFKVTLKEGEASVNVIAGNPHVVSVVNYNDSEASLRFNGPGKGYVTVQSGTKTKTVNYTVKQHAGKLDASVNEVIVVKKGESIRLNARPDNATTDTIKWAVVGDKSVCSISSLGMLKGKKAGEAEVTATPCDGKTKYTDKAITFKIKVEEGEKQTVEPADVSINFLGNRTMYTGEKAYINADITPASYNTGKPVKYKIIEGKGVIAVDQYGHVTAKKPGTAKIAVICGSLDSNSLGEDKVVTIEVKEPVRLFKISKSYAKVKASAKGKNLQLAVKSTPSLKTLIGRGTVEVTWKVNTPGSLVTVADGFVDKKDGKIKFHIPSDAGNTVVTADIYDKVLDRHYETSCMIDMNKPAAGSSVTPDMCISSMSTADMINVYDHGARPDDEGNDTGAIREAIEYANGIKTVDDEKDPRNTVYIPKGTYYIDGKWEGIKMLDDVCLIIDPEAVLLQERSDGEQESGLVTFTDVKNATVIGGKLVGDRRMHPGVSNANYNKSQNQHGVRILGGENNSVVDMEITDNLGDGIYLGSKGQKEALHGAKGVLIDNCTLYDNRRQNISIITAQDVRITHCTLNYMLDKSESMMMRCNIDIEPNAPKGSKTVPDNMICRNILIEDTVMRGKTSGIGDGSSYFGVVTNAYPHNRSWKTCENVTVNRCTVYGDFGNYSGSSFTISNSTITGTLFDGRGTKIVNSKIAAVSKWD